MGLSGAILEMIQRSAENRAALQGRRERAVQMRRRYVSQAPRVGEVAEKRIAPEELERIRAEIRLRERLERRRAVRRTLFLWIVLAVGVVGGMVFLLSRVGWSAMFR